MNIHFLHQHLKCLKQAPLQKEGVLLQFDVDSRNINQYQEACFIALNGNNIDGHFFIPELYEKGVSCFIITDLHFDHSGYPNATFFYLNTPHIDQLQELAILWRKELKHCKILAITGSNGKTTVKEWLKTLIRQKTNQVSVSPLSYNSQLGVPLSILSIQETDAYAIIEAGISEAEEMAKLERIIKPQFGLLTYFGDAHNSGFPSMEEKWNEKRLLFKSCVNYFVPDKYRQVFPNYENALFFGEYPDSFFNFHLRDNQLVFHYQNMDKEISLNENNLLHYENVKNCIAALFLLGFDPCAFNYDHLRPLKMRQEVIAGREGATIINDSYNSDWSGIHYSLEIFLKRFLDHRIIILSEWDDPKQTSLAKLNLVKQLLSNHKYKQLIWLSKTPIKDDDILCFQNKEKLVSFLNETPAFWSHQNIFIKGSREWSLEDLSQLLSEKKNVSKLEVNIKALENNINAYQSLLPDHTEIMAVVKANAYGIRLAELVPSLEKLGIHFFAVANIDEAIELRKLGVKGRILSLQNFGVDTSALHQYQIEASIYNFDVLHQICTETSYQNQNLEVHLKFNTGMGRLGFKEEDATQIIQYLKKHPQLKLASVFSHLPSADIPEQDALTQDQFTQLKRIQQHFELSGYHCQAHISNSAGIERFSNENFDYARLGIGMFGIASDAHFQKKLQNVLSLKSYVVQVEKINAGTFISYGRRYESKQEELIITIPLGYADGIPRSLSNGKGSVFINGFSYPIVGSICMDFTMVAAPIHSNINIGDEVEFFGPGYSLSLFAEKAHTIPYEILTHIAPRIKRVYTNA